MKILIILILASTSCFAQHGVLYPAYIKGSASDYEKLIIDNFKKHPSNETIGVFKKHPILISMEHFKKRIKYSFISESLLAYDPILSEDCVIFIFKNGKKYIVKLKRQIRL